MHRRGHLTVAPTGKNVRRRPTLPHPLGCSTIGAERLNFRVRDGTGCFPFAMAAVTLVAFTLVRGVFARGVAKLLGRYFCVTRLVVLCVFDGGREHGVRLCAVLERGVL